MFTMILMLYLQQHLDVTLESAKPHGEFKSRQECEAAAVRLRGPVPVPRTYSAAWQDALCVQVQREVRVNEGDQAGLGKVLRDQPASGCQAEGAWRRVAEMARRAPR
jgi:hypothetical protein